MPASHCVLPRINLRLLNRVPNGSIRDHHPARAPMTSISHLVAPAHTSAAPAASSRNLALDRTRTFLTLVVVLHHAVIPYTYFGHTDPKSWLGFDAVVLATD